MKLNGATIPDAIVQRVIQRRGARLYERRYRICGGARIARYCAGSQPAGGDGARDWGGVFWIKMTHDERCFSEWSVAYVLPTPDTAPSASRRSPRGNLAMSCGLSSISGPRMRSSRNTATAPFMFGTSALRPRARGFDTVLITGTVTNVCCESSARDGNVKNFRTIMVSDGNAALSQAEHDASLAGFLQYV
jgi:ureidoacrylate peracid hydrolase